jgi:hypothetical protein
LRFSALLNRFRPPSDADLHSVTLYRATAHDVSARLRSICQAWDGLRQIEPDYTRLANTAAVNRWTTMRQAHQLERLTVPRALTTLHRDLSAALDDAARAWQLLANGYRSYKSEAVCDGQALLVDAAAAVEGISQALEARLAAAPPASARSRTPARP